MSFLRRHLSKFPVSTETKLAWRRQFLDKSYSTDIAQARKANNAEKVEDLESCWRFESQMLDEEEDGYITKRLLAQARRLRVPIPRHQNQNGAPSELWYQGRQTGAFCLTIEGMSALREEIRKELKARHELRSQWNVWIGSLTGLIGTIAALVALLIER